MNNGIVMGHQEPIRRLADMLGVSKDARSWVMSVPLDGVVTVLINAVDEDTGQAYRTTGFLNCGQAEDGEYRFYLTNRKGESL
jgi:hypothetical protein